MPVRKRDLPKTNEGNLHVDYKRDVRQTVLCLSPTQTRIVKLLQDLPIPHTAMVSFRVPVYPDGRTGPGELFLKGGCENRRVDECPSCGHRDWTGFTVEFVWIGNRFNHGFVDRESFRSLRSIEAEIKRRVAQANGT